MTYNIVALVSAEPCSRVEKDGDDEEEQQEGRQAESHHAQEQLQKCIEEADYMAASVARRETKKQLKEGIVALVSRQEYSEAARWQFRLKRYQEKHADR